MSTLEAVVRRTNTALDVLPVVLYRGSASGVPIIVGFYIAHFWGLESLALYTVASAVVAMASVVVDWGAAKALPRELTISPDPRAYVAACNGVRLITFLSLVAVAIACLGAGYLSSDLGWYLLVLAPTSLTAAVGANALSSRIVSSEMDLVLFGSVVGLAILIGAGWWVVAARLHPLTFLAALAASRVVETAVLLFGRTWVLALTLRGSLVAIRNLWPFTVQAILGIAYSRLPIFVLEHQSTRIQLGIFSAAIGLQSAVLLVPAAMALLVYPKLTAAAARSDFHDMRRLVLRYLRYSLATVGLSCLVAYLSMNPLTAFLRLPPSSDRFVLSVVLVAALSSVSIIGGIVLQSLGGERTVVWLSLCTLSLAFGYQTLAVSRLGLSGSVLALFAAELSSCVLTAFAIYAVLKTRRLAS